MTLENYQEFTKTTAIYPVNSALEYLGLGLASEAGEVAGKIKKLIRGDVDNVDDIRYDLKLELGDVLYYISELCTQLDFSIKEVLQANADKLVSRKAKGTLRGSGDGR